MPRKPRKPKQESTDHPPDAPRSETPVGGGRNKRNKREDDFIDEEVKDLILKIGESDNTAQSRQAHFLEKALVEFLQKNVEEMYPNIGKETYRVPDVHINKGKHIKNLEDGMMGFEPPQETDSRSDRAHSFVSDMIFHLSIELKSTSVGPFFIISSYEYDDFLSRLKASMLKTEENLNGIPSVNIPKDTASRGEIDIMIVLCKHVIFVEIKAIGDNFGDYSADKGKITKDNIEKARKQLIRDEKVFNHVMKDLNPDGFKKTKIAALPNLERSYLDKAMSDPELREMCQDMKFLCKEDMPKDRLDFHTDFHVFREWWMTNVFPGYKKELDHSQIAPDAGPPEEHVNSDTGNNHELSPLEEVKVIVGRYVGFMSVVQVCKTSNSSSRRIEVRRKGQAVEDVGRRFADIVLTNDQRKYLDENIKLGYLCGPPGSGKTVVLAMKARRWIMNDGNYVVVVNMYRGAPGRAIGKQIFRTITKNSVEEKENYLRSHCMEIGVDVSNFRREEFLEVVRSRPEWKDAVGDRGEKIMFIVDETYVQSYWDSVFSTLRGDFEAGSLWCAGLYGKQPEGFKSMELKLVIRCPPTVQEVLKLIDWDKNRLQCYITDGTTACLPTNGPHVLTVRHQEHGEFAKVPPSKCRLCGEELAKILGEDLNVEKPATGHKAADLKLSSLKCSDILFLVNMPRDYYKCDVNNFLDTTEADYKKYMATYDKCEMLETLKKAGYPYKVHNQLSCPDLISPDVKQVINVTWIYTYQGLENKVIVFIPGDEAIPQDGTPLEAYLRDPLKNIPCPGLQGMSKDQKSGRSSVCVQRDSSKEESDGDEDSGKFDVGAQGASAVADDIGQSSSESSEGEAGSAKKLCDGPSQGIAHETVTDIGQLGTVHSKEDRIFRTEDVERYSRWDKNNLFISASRCTSQLILMTR